MRTTRPPVVDGLSLALQAASSDTSTSTTETIQASYAIVPDFFNGLLGAKFAFQARPGSPGTTVATAVFTGQVGAASGRMTFNVFETRLLKTYFERTPKNADCHS